MDYIHYNLVKHGWCDSPAQWPYSTFQRYVAAGKSAAQWAAPGVGEEGMAYGDDEDVCDAVERFRSACPVRERQGEGCESI